MNQKYYYLSILLTGITFLHTQNVAAQNHGFEKDVYVKIQGVTSDAQITALTPAQGKTVFTYNDGLARPLQTVDMQSSPLGNDIIQPIAYNNLGMQTAGYLPYAGKSTDVMGSYRPNAISTDQPAFYNNTAQHLVATDNAPYDQQVFENSPLYRLLSSGMMGAGFQPVGAPLPGGSGTQHYKTVTHRFNNAADGNIMSWNPDGTFTTNTYYAVNTLEVTDGKDEQGVETLSFTDNAGHVILKRQLLSATNVDTYYIYNLAGMPAFIIPPKALTLMIANNSYSLTQTGVSKLIFQFTYDGHGRLTQKIVPGKGPVSIIYDPLNRPVLLQDANMLVNNQWNYIKYDAKGRPVSQGVYTDSNSGRIGAVNMQAYVNTLTYTTWYESRSTTLTNNGYYTSVVFPTSSTGTLTPLAYAYFDDYNINNDVNNTADFSYASQGLTGETGATTASVKGAPTVTCKTTVGPGLTNVWLTKVVFYDKKGNTVQQQSNNHLYYQGMLTLTDNATSVVDFSGVPQVSKVTKQSSATVSTSVQTSYVYDPMNRLLSVGQAYNGGTAKTVAAYSYNELGLVIKKGLGFVSGTTYLQNLDMRYNIRGQLLSINNGTLTNDNGITNSDMNDLFGMTFLYDQTGANNLGNTPRYNGNLSAVTWMSKDGNGLATNERAFNYTYDQLNRYTSSAYAERLSAGTTFTTNTATYNETITYNSDNSGNIQNLTRGKSTAYMDNLTYSYDPNQPNQLHTVTDAGNLAQGFYNLTGASTPYLYDVNGNLTNDYYKGLTIGYNYLNRTDKITVTTGQWIDYTYDGSGNLLRKRQYTNSTLQNTTDYMDGFVYINSTLSYFPMPEGRVMNNGGTLTQEFIVTDQQGNARISFNNTGTGGTAKVVQENSYYGTGLTIQPIVAGDNNKNLYNGGAEWQNDYNNLPDYYQTFNRNYDAALGRFISVDPKAESTESMTGYQYANNNPIMYNDPLGDLPDYLGYSDLQIQLMKSRGAGPHHGNLPSDYNPDYGNNNSNYGVMPDDLLARAMTGDPTSVQQYGEMYGSTVYQASGTGSDDNTYSGKLLGEVVIHDRGVSFPAGWGVATVATNTSAIEPYDPYTAPGTWAEIWNSHIMRLLIPDMINVNVSFSRVFGVGNGISHEAHFLLRGPDAGIYSSFTYSQRTGVFFDLSGGVSASDYLSTDVRNIKYSDYLGDAVELGGKMVGGASFSISHTGWQPTWLTVGGSAGLSIGGYIGTSQTVPFMGKKFNQ